MDCGVIGRRGRESGYTMVLFVMVIAVMSIMMGVAVQTADFQMRREREAELIFRGQQYVEAIRLFRLRFGRYPMRLEELWEAKPRVIRKPWQDPMPEGQGWGLIFLGQEGEPIGGQGGSSTGSRTGVDATGTPEAGGQPDEDENQPPSSTRLSGDDDRSPRPAARRGAGGLAPRPMRGASGTEQREAFGRRQGEQVGPIVGVHSKVNRQSVKVYEGRTNYQEWRFVYREAPGAGSGRPGGGRPRPTPVPERPDEPWGWKPPEETPTP